MMLRELHISVCGSKINYALYVALRLIVLVDVALLLPF